MKSWLQGADWPQCITIEILGWTKKYSYHHHCLSMFSLWSWSTWHPNATRSPEVSAPNPKFPTQLHLSLLLSPSLPSRSTAWNQRRIGAAFCVSQHSSMQRQRACVLKPSLPWAAQLQTMWRQGWRTSGKPEHQQGNAHSIIPKDGKSVALRFWSQSHTGCSCESKTMFPKVSMIRLSP